MTSQATYFVAVLLRSLKIVVRGQGQAGGFFFLRVQFSSAASLPSAPSPFRSIFVFTPWPQQQASHYAPGRYLVTPQGITLHRYGTPKLNPSLPHGTYLGRKSKSLCLMQHIAWHELLILCSVFQHSSYTKHYAMLVSRSWAMMPASGQLEKPGSFA